MSVYAGLDGGSTYLKAALIDHTGKVLNTGVKSTGIDNNGAAKVLLEQLCRDIGVSRIDYTMATGYSRKILEVADDDVSEITAHAYGVRITAPQGYRPGLIVDIGGQDSKVIYLDDQYRVKNFSMSARRAPVNSWKSSPRSWRQPLIRWVRSPWKAQRPVISTAPASCLLSLR